MRVDLDPGQDEIGPTRSPTPVRALNDVASNRALGVTPLPIERRSARAFKRTIDLLVAVPASLVLALGFPLLIVAMKATTRGPIFFSQTRVGRDGKPIRVRKLRSMYVDAEERLVAEPELYAQYRANGFKLPDGKDPRITPFGHLLRKTSLDETPQIFSVLRGTMSVVGPRPVVPPEFPVLYGADTACYTACKPGLTGLWQVSGRSHVHGPRRASLDYEYATTWTYGLDLKILVRTIPAVFQAHGAH